MEIRSSDAPGIEFRRHPGPVHRSGRPLHRICGSPRRGPSPVRAGPGARTGSLWRWPIFTVPAAAGTEFRTLLTGSVIRLSGRSWRWTPPEMWSGTAETPGAGAGANDALTVAGLGACVVGVVLVLLLSRRVLGSVGGLTTAARNPGHGDLSSRVAVKGNDEIAELGHAFNAMADALEDSELQAAQDSCRRRPRTATDQGAGVHRQVGRSTRRTRSGRAAAQAPQQPPASQPRRACRLQRG